MAPETTVIPSNRALLTPEKRDTYLKALNELVGTLSGMKWTRLDIEAFCQKHNLKPSFFTVLRDLDCIVLNLVAGEPNWYKSTPELLKIDPETVSRKMRGIGAKKEQVNESVSASAVVDEPKNSEPVRPESIHKEVVSEPVVVSNDTFLENMFEKVDNNLPFSKSFIVKVDTEQVQISYQIKGKNDVRVLSQLLDLLVNSD